MSETTVVDHPKTEIAVFRGELQNMGGQFQAVLPQHIPLERFERVVLTAAQNNPDLLSKCTRRSLFNACMKAAQDGLLPDGRLGAIVPFKGQAQWMPMVAGIRQKVRNSGEILDWDVTLVYANDFCKIRFGTQREIIHEPFMGEGDRGAIKSCYSIAHFKGGGMSIDYMTIAEVEAVRAQASRARSPDSPWQIPAYYPEMVKKTVARRHSKMLPMSSDLDDLMRADDDLYEFDKPKEIERPSGRQRLGAALNALASPDVLSAGTPADDIGGSGETTSQDAAKGSVDAKTGEVTLPPAAQTKTGDAITVENKTDKPMTVAAAEGKPKAAPPKIPTTEAEYRLYAKGWIDASADGMTEMDGQKIKLRERWTHISEKKLRNTANVSGDAREQIFEYLMSKQTEKLGG